MGCDYNFTVDVIGSVILVLAMLGLIALAMFALTLEEWLRKKLGLPPL